MTPQTRRESNATEERKAAALFAHIARTCHPNSWLRTALESSSTTTGYYRWIENRGRGLHVSLFTGKDRITVGSAYQMYRRPSAGHRRDLLRIELAPLDEEARDLDDQANVGDVAARRSSRRFADVAASPPFAMVRPRQDKTDCDVQPRADSTA